MTPDTAADLHTAQSHETIALDLLVALGMPRDADVATWVAAESTAAKAAHAHAQGTRHADVAACCGRASRRRKRPSRSGVGRVG